MLAGGDIDMAKFNPGDTVYIHRGGLFLDHRGGFLKATVVKITPLARDLDAYYTILVGTDNRLSPYWPERLLHSTEEAIAETLAR
jgi:hypothetical protein